MRAFDGTVSIVQPLIAPLYAAVGARAARGAHGRPGATPTTTRVRDHWTAQPRPRRRTSTSSGARRSTTASSRARRCPRSGQRRRLDSRAPAASPPRQRRARDRLPPDPARLDGRFANNGWLQELPQAADEAHVGQRRVHRPGDGARLGLTNEDVVEIQYRERTREGAGLGAARPCRRVGHACISGTAARGPARVAEGAGFDAYAAADLRRAVVRVGAAAAQDGRRYPPRRPRGTTRWRAATSYASRPRGVQGGRGVRRTMAGSAAETLRLYPDGSTTGTRGAWRSTQTACIGCNACVVACQAENNIPVVGKEQVCAAARCTGSGSTATSQGAARQPGRSSSSRCCAALREGAVRAGLPGRGDGAQPRGPERDDLQPLRRHAVLLEQLPLQGAAVQLPAYTPTATRRASSCCATPTSRSAAAA